MEGRALYVQEEPPARGAAAGLCPCRFAQRASNCPWALARTVATGLWGWWVVPALTWYACAIFSVAVLNNVEHKSLMSMFANLGFGWPLLAPFALRQGVRPLINNWRRVLAIAVLQGLEKNLTNSSLYHIGAALKTALHGCNVVFVFFVAAFMGADELSRGCLLGCQCRSKVLLTVSIVLVASGGVVTAVFSHGKDGWAGGWEGILLQGLSGLVYALKFTFVKLLLRGGDDRTFVEADQMPPSRSQIAFVANPVTGLISLAFVAIFEENWGVPDLGLSMALAVSVTLTLIAQLRLTELTSPLTVAVLAVFHDVAIVLFVVHFQHEWFHRAQSYGFVVSSLGALLYGCERREKRHADRGNGSSDSTQNDSIDSSIEQTYDDGYH